MSKLELYFTIFMFGFFTCSTLVGVYVDRPFVYVISGVLASVSCIATMVFMDGGSK